VLFETQSDPAADRVESIGSKCEQEFNLADPEQETLCWRRASKDNLLMKALKEMTGLLAHTVEECARDTEKTIKTLKKF
jgi:hypothetical protein